MATSEVARIRQQIDTELEAMKRGLYAVAAGTAKHEFIRAKMDSVGSLVDTLSTHVGKQEALQISCLAYIRIMGQEGE